MEHLRTAIEPGSIGAGTRYPSAPADYPLCYEQVYYISKGKVKLANRAYASVKNDYAISLDGRRAACPHLARPM